MLSLQGKKKQKVCLHPRRGGYRGKICMTKKGGDLPNQVAEKVMDTRPAPSVNDGGCLEGTKEG